ncbi:MAG: pyridoxal phosphate-dependent aminotransferase, partial [Candidatus Ranarchaeia archaeon]
FEKQTLKLLADLAIDNDLLVISDEIYSEIRYDSFEHTSIGSFPGMKERTIVVDGFSKTFAMTGWRIGYLTGSPSIVKAAAIIQQASTSCAAQFTQFAALEALTNHGIWPIVGSMVEEYKSRRDFIVNSINETPSLTCSKPVGAFYVFLSYPSKLGSSSSVAERILTEKHVSCTPGSAFGATGEYHLRLSYATAMDTLKRGIKSLHEFFDGET